ncbi:MAG: DUF3472 domain-containing protein [Kiritimatiellae bacterium]|nr:DUF3472 domain-containing protein [Kiritimatiellia bacterium]
MKRILMTIGFVCCAAWLYAFPSGEEQAARQARSVHLQHLGWGKPAKIFYLEATMEQSYPGTYFATIAFDGGYCGIQELPTKHRIAIFSIWEPGNPLDPKANPNNVEEIKRTKTLYQGENVHIQRFGGEGTGGKSMMWLNWEHGKPVYMAISVAPDGEHHTAFTCWIWDVQKQDWFRMATFSTLFNKGKAELTGPYSFVEDFLRNVESRNHVRCGYTSPLWAWDGTQWSSSTKARFTADNNTLTTIDAGSKAGGFWMATGGSTTNVTTKLWNIIQLQSGNIPDDSATRRAKLVEAVKAAETATATP